MQQGNQRGAFAEQLKGENMKVFWNDDATAGKSPAQAMADTYGFSQEAVLAWYQKAMKAIENLDRAKEAVEGLMKEEFVVTKYEYDERDQRAYHAHYWGRLLEAVSLTSQVCPVCEQSYLPGTHECL